MIYAERLSPFSRLSESLHNLTNQPGYKREHLPPRGTLRAVIPSVARDPGSAQPLPRLPIFQPSCLYIERRRRATIQPNTPGLGNQAELSMSTVGAPPRLHATEEESRHFVIESEALYSIGSPMPSTILAVFLEFSRPAIAMCSAGIALFLIGAWAAKNDIANSRGLDKIAALSHLCFAIPLAVFGAEHLSMPQSLMTLVPLYMPWRLFWAYFVGFALIIASLSIAAKIAVRWSGLLFGLKIGRAHV